MVIGVTGNAVGMLNNTSSKAIHNRAITLTIGPTMRPKFHRAFITCSRLFSKLIAMGMAYARANACTPTETNAVKALVLPRLINPRSI